MTVLIRDPEPAAVKAVPMDPPASRIPAAIAREAVVQRELAALRLQIAECVLACAEAKPRARQRLAELRQKISLAEFELAGIGMARDLAAKLDTEAFVAWKADIQALPPEAIVDGISKDQCCRRCRSSGDCVIVGADPIPGECAHPILAGQLHQLRHQANPKIVAVYRAAVAKVGARR